MMTRKKPTYIPTFQVNRFTKSRRSQGHVEIIFSFIIFISFLSFLLIVFNPFKNVGQTENHLNLAQSQIEKIITKNIESITFNINGEQISGCYYLNYNYPKEIEVVVKDISGNNFISNYEHNKINIDLSSSNTFYIIYFSEDFAEKEEPDCSPQLLEEQHTLGLLKKYNFASFKQINETLAVKYNTNYSELKKEIGIPQTKDFSISFYKLDRTEILRLGNTPEKTAVYARDIPIQIIYQNGDFEYGFMNIRIW